MKNIGQKPCEDAISRQAVLSKIKEVCFSEEWVQFRVDNGSNGQRDFIINYIEQLPPATPQPKTGHWIGIDEEPHEDYECNNCGYVVSTYTANIEPHTEYKYCPNCGARMQEVEE